MKQFIKYVCATVVGVFLVVAILSILSIMGLISMAALSESSTTQIQDKSVLVLQLEGSIEERSEENPFSKLMGNSVLEKQGLDDILCAIDKAKKDEKIKGIYIEAGNFEGAMPSTLQEIRNALVDFKKEGKFIVSYGDTYTQGAYYLCSVADSVVINPQGMINLCGLASQVVYYKDFLDKIGVEMQVVKVGTYKSAVEPFLLSEMSEANREQIEVYDGEIWGEITKAISKSRGVKVDKLNELTDSAVFFAQPKTYLKEKLVDKIAFSDEVSDIIINMMGGDDYNTVSVTDLAGVDDDSSKSLYGDVVAVYYAVGDIVDEDESGGFDSEPQIVSKDVIRDLKELADDDDVKAVVLRVNSGGGSAYASEQIWHQVMNIKAKKPIVVSMGDMAASGGYYISCAADYIYAEPTTLTGSIGIFGMFPSAGELINNTLGIHFCTVKTNEHADFGDISRPFTASERNIMQRYVNDGYELFTKRCADGRKMKQEDIKKIGEGRVWTGLHAKQIGLVDELGGLSAAVNKAKKLAKAENATVVSYPAKDNFFDELLNEVEGGGSSYADAQMRNTLGEYYNIYSSLKNVKSKTGVQTSLPYCLKFNL